MIDRLPSTKDDKWGGSDGSITKLANGHWKARYRTPDEATRSKTFVKKADVDRFLTSVEHSKLVGGYVDPAAGRVTFGSYAQQWMTRQVHRPSTAAQLETNMRRHVLPVLGGRPLASIRPSEVQA